MLPRWAKRIGKWWLLVLGSFFATGVSYLITTVLMSVFYGGLNPVARQMGLLIPLFSGTPVLYVLINLLFKLDEARQDLERLAVTDELTEAYNRRYLQLQMEKEIERCRRYGHAFSLVMIDCDNFKQLNDTRGHPAGDAFLQHLSQVVHARIRKTDVFARIGGDEFVLLLPNTNAVQAEALAEDLHRILCQLKQENSHAGDCPVTVSMGVTTWNPLVGRPDELMATLDEALYQAKHAGKNQVAII
ncbi:MAG: GGDEF domain-containing protein [Anaerolineae bacterium]|nr:GGDEF domain-containing protein [Anaerolineae bacterium]